MAGTRDKPEVIVLELRQVEVLQGQGSSVADAERQIGMTQQTYYRWRKDYGSMSRDQLKRLKELETENTRLKRAVSDLTLDKMILTEAARGTEGPRSELLSPSRRRRCITMCGRLSAYRSAGSAAHWDSIARRGARCLSACQTKNG